jgi:hypothetical protein
MKLIRNVGADRVIDWLGPQLITGRRCDLVSSALSLFAFAELLPGLAALERCCFILPPPGSDLALLGTAADRAARNRLQRRRARRGAHRQVGHRHPQHRRLEEALQVPARRRRRRDRQAGRFGGCIIADSVGLGKTFEALAIIKYHELRNDRVLVLVPKAPARQLDALQGQRPAQLLAPDRFNYDVLNHTDLSRDGGAVRRHRPRPRQLGQLRPRRHRRVAQLPQQEDPRAMARPATTA